MSRRYCALFLTMLCIITGLALRRYGTGLPLPLQAYGPDVLWGAMVYWGISFLLDRQPSHHAILALIFAYGIEISQLYHRPWIDAIRATTLGHLVLGYGFLWSDLLCYGFGIIISYFFARQILAREA